MLKGGGGRKMAFQGKHLLLLLLLLLLLEHVRLVRGASSGITSVCMQDASIILLECSSLHIGVSLEAVPVPGVTTCARGSMVHVGGVRATLVTTQSKVYDVGLWISKDGGDALTGTCVVYMLEPVSDLNLDLDLTSGMGPYYNGEISEVRDRCGDMRSSQGTVLFDTDSLVLPCNDMGSLDSYVTTNVCVAWTNNANRGLPCEVPTDAVPSQSSRCNCHLAELDPILVGDVPIAVNDTAFTLVLSEVCKNVLANDEVGAPNGASLNVSTLSIVELPLEGVAVINGSFICYTPLASTVNEVDVLLYRVCSEHESTSDGTGDFCTTAYLRIGVGTPPLCMDDFHVGLYETLQTIDVISNDVAGLFPIDNGSVNVPLDAACGTYISTEPVSGNISWSPNMGFDGNCTFDYEVCSILLVCTSCSVIVEVRRPPNAILNVAFTTVNTSAEVDVLSNDVVHTYPIDAGSVTIVVPPEDGFISHIDGITGAITYDPPTGVSGVFSYAYRVCDTVALCDAALVVITVRAPPQCSLIEEHIASSDVLFTDITLHVTTGILGAGVLNVSATVVTAGPSNGAIVDIVDSVIQYDPAPAYDGLDEYTYRACQEDGQCCENVVNVTVHAPPLCLGNAYCLRVNSTMNELNVTDAVFPGSNPLNYSSVTIAVPPDQGGTIDSIDGGTGTITYTPAPAPFALVVETFSYEICDTAAACCTAQVVVDLNVGVEANDDAYTVRSSTDTMLNATQNDVNGTTPLDVTTSAIVSGPYLGTVLNISSMGVLLYRSASLGADNMTYRLCDTCGLCDEALISIDVVAGPLAVDDVESGVIESEPVDVPVLSNDIALSAPLDPSTVTIVGTGPMNGTILINTTTGIITYSPAIGACGPDAFNYSVFDVNAFGDEAKVDPFINCAPTGRPDAAFLPERHLITPLVEEEEEPEEPEIESICIDVLVNDEAGTSPINGSTISICEYPTNGTLVNITGAPDFEICYATVVDYQGIDTFKYKVCDEFGLCTNCTTVVVVVVDIDPVYSTCVGFVFNDENANGVHDFSATKKTVYFHTRALEEYVSGVTVLITDSASVTRSTVTDANGAFLVSGVAAGPATLEIVVPDSYFVTTPPNPRAFTAPTAGGIHTPVQEGMGLARIQHGETPITSADTIALIVGGVVIVMLLVLGVGCAVLDTTTPTMLPITSRMKARKMN
jgi:hypothetical protein